MTSRETPQKVKGRAKGRRRVGAIHKKFTEGGLAHAYSMNIKSILRSTPTSFFFHQHYGPIINQINRRREPRKFTNDATDRGPAPECSASNAYTKAKSELSLGGYLNLDSPPNARAPIRL